MALLMIAIFPLTGVGQALRMRYQEGRHQAETKLYEEAGKVVFQIFIYIELYG
jgi:hypothetical protein